MNCEYAREAYGVPAEITLMVKYKGRPGIIAEDRGNYVGVNFNADKPGHILNIHPTDPGLEYLSEKGTIRKLTRSHQRYQDYLHSELVITFAEWLGIDKQNKTKV